MRLAAVSINGLSIDRLIQAKKLMFLRTITTLDDDAECKKILVETSNRYLEDVGKCSQNVTNSPIFEMFNVTKEVGLSDMCINMITNGHYYPKNEWRGILWQTIWKQEEQDCVILY